jgi:hypothetical protein
MGSQAMEHCSQCAYGRIQACREEGPKHQRCILQWNFTRISGVVDLRAEASRPQRFALALLFNPRQYTRRVGHRLMIEGIFRSETRKHHFSITKERVFTIIINAESFNKDRERKYFCKVFDVFASALFSSACT